VIQLESGASISGTVLSDEGKPIEGAKVAFYRKRQTAGNVSISRFDDREAVETDENGYFRLGGIEADSVVLRAWADGHGEQQIDNVQIGASSVVFHLARHGSISGILVDSQGEPLAGSRVWVKKDRGLPGLQLFESIAEARSAEDGSFVLEGVPAGDVQVTADGDDHRPVEPQAVSMPAAGRVDDLRLIAETGAVLEVLVLDAEGEPVAGAEVSVKAFQEQQNRSGSFQTRDVRAVRRAGGGGETFVFGGMGGALGKGTTDEAGRVRIAGLPEETVSIEAEHAEMVTPAEARAELNSARVVETTLNMQPGGFITVHTLDANGEARPETDFAITGPLAGGETGETEEGRSNGEGVATIGPLAAGTYSAVLGQNNDAHYSPEGGMEIRISGQESKTLRDSEQSVVVKAGETAEVSLVRPILTHFNGMLSDATGPVSGARVALREGDGPSLPFGDGGLRAKTDRDGNFSIENIQAGTYTLEYGREGALIMHEEELVIPPAQAELTRNLTLRGGSLRVAVVDDVDGMPVERAKVALKRPGEGGSSGGGQMNVMMVSRSVDSSGPSSTTVEVGGGASSVTTDEDGIAVLEDIPPGEYVLEIKHSRFADQKVESVKISDGKVTEQSRVALSPAGFIRGTVTGFGEDAGMRMALVRLKEVGSEDDPKRQPAINGTFSFDGLRPGMYELSAKRLGMGGPSEEWGESQIVEVVAGKRARPQLQLPQN
jgi:protocatechuate 3,4-dioxygenase beta subunit